MTVIGLSRRAFAEMIGKSVGHVQHLVDTGRCVLTPEGKINGPASRQRMAETEGGRPDVAERHAANRAAAGKAPGAAVPPADNTPPPGIDVGGPAHTDGTSRAKAKALLMHYENSSIKLEMALRRGMRFERAAVKREAAGLGAMLRAGIERVIDQTAPRLAAASNELQRRQIVEKEIRRLRHMMKRELPRALRRMKDSNLQKKSGDAA